MTPTTSRRAAMLLGAALGALAGCQPAAPTPAPCNETCSQQPDTVSIIVIWDSPDGTWPAGATGTVDWSKAGAPKAHQTHQLTDQFHLYNAWEHDWAAQGYPKITVTADTSVDGYGVRCFLNYQPPDGGRTVVLDFQQRGAADGTGQVHCDSEQWSKLNPGGKP